MQSHRWKELFISSVRPSNSQKGTVLGEEHLSGIVVQATTDHIAGTEARAKGNARTLVVINLTVVPMIPVRLFDPPGLLVQRKASIC